MARSATRQDFGARFLRLAAFSALLTLYAWLLAALAWLLPYALLVGIAAWVLIRRPDGQPQRIDADVRLAVRRSAEVLELLALWLVRPLRSK